MEIRVGVVTGSHVDTNGDGTEPGRVLQVIVTDITDVQNVQTCQAGDEYNPPDGAAVMLSAGGNAYKVALALDDGIAPMMAKGGKRIYATDAEGVAEVAEARLHPDGKVELLNSEASLTMLPDGTVTAANGLANFTMQPDGTVIAANGATSFTMSPAGVFTFHGTGSHFDHPVTMASTLEVATSVTAPNIAGTTDVTFAGKSAASHTHSDPQGGTTGVPT